MNPNATKRVTMEKKHASDIHMRFIPVDDAEIAIYT
jgi:hypothetical protein